MVTYRTNSLQKLVLMWRLHDAMKCNASVKMQSFLSAWSPGKNGDPQIGWMNEGVLEQTGCSFQVPTTVHNPGLITVCLL